MATILVVDDKKDNLVALRAIIHDALPEAILFSALNGPEGIEIAKSKEPDVILLGILNPDMDGFEVCRLLKQDENLQDIPVVFLSESKSDSENRSKALESGADGFLTVPFDGSELIAQVKVMTKIKISNKLKRNEQQRLEQLIAGRTHALEISRSYVPKLLIDLKKEIESHKETEEALRQSEAQFRNFFENAADAIFIADIESGRIVDANQAACKLMMMPFDKIIGLHQSQLHPADETRSSVDSFVSAVESSKLTSPPQLFEKKVIRSDGQLVLVEILASMVNFNGKQCLLGTFRDITERKKTETALHDSEERQHLLLNKIDEIIYSLNIDNDLLKQTVVFVSKQSEQILGYAPEEFITNQSLWFSIIHPDDIKAVSEITQKSFLTKENLIRTYRARHKLTGEYIWIEDRPQYLFDESGNITGVFGSARNISEQKRVEDALLESQQMFRNLTMVSPVGIFRTRTDGYTTYVNPRWSELSGISSDEAIGDGWLKAIHPDDRETAINHWRSDVENQKNSVSEYRFLKSDGTVVWVKGNAVPEIIDNIITGYIGTITDITADKEAEAALRESEEKYRILIENQNDLIVKVDSEGAFLFVSPSYCKLFGKSESELLGNHFIPLVHEDDRQSTIEAMELLKVSPFTCNVEQRAMTVDGWKWLEWANKAVLDEHGEIDYIIGVGREISERKQVENALQKSRKEFQAYFDSASVGMSVTAPDKSWIEVNNRLCQMLGYAREELSGKTWDELSHPGEVDLNRELFEKALEGRIDNYEMDKRFFRKDGSIVYVTLSVVCQRNDDGSANRFLSSYIDITERKLAEETLLKAENHFRGLIEKAPDGIALINAEGRFTFISPAAKKMFGFSSDEIVEFHPDELTHPDDLPKVLDEVSKAFTDNSYIPTLQYRFRSKDGSWRWIESSFTNLFDNPDIEALVVNFRDVTDRRQYEEMIHHERIMLRTLIDNLPDPIYILDKEGRKVVANKADVDNIGYNVEAEVFGKNDLDLFAGEIGLRGHADNMSVITSGNPIINREENFIDKDGMQRWLLTSKFPLYDAHGQITGLVGLGYDITERKRADDFLIRNEEKYRLLFKNNPQTMWIYDLETLAFLEVNDAAVMKYGYSKEEFLNMTLKDIRPEEDIEKLLVDTSVTSAIYNFAGEWRHKTKNGEIRFVEITSHLIEFGNKSARLVLVNDITDRKTVQEEIIRSKEIYKAFFDDDLTGDFISSVDGKLIDCNPAYIGMLGFDSKEQAMQVDLSTLFPGHPGRRYLIELVSEHGRLTEYEFELVRVDGKPLYAIANIIGLFDEEGKLESIKGYIIDNTRRKLAEMELVKLSRAVEQNPASIIITDVKGNIEYVNPKFSQLTGYSFDEVVGKNPRILKSGFTPDEDYTQLWKSILSGKEWQGEFQNRKKNGEIYYESVLISPISDEKGNIMSFLAVKEDITGKKSLMEDLIAAKEKAEESDRLKSSFLANMSHEIRTPMNGILGFMGLLQEPNLTGDERDEYIKIVKISGNRLLSTINDIIDISKIESGQSIVSISETDVNKIMQQLYRFFLPEAEEKGLGFQINELLPENNTRVQTDGYKLESVLVNLIKNALKFTRSGAIGFGCHIDGRLIRFTVSDTGVGIPPNRKGSIFERFVQAETSLSRPFEGSGLGLSISKAYVEMMGGEIMVKSELGKGSEFSFTIQYHPLQMVELPTLDQSVNGKVEIGSDKVILVAEDDDISFFFLKKVLANEKLRLVRAPDGMEAVRLCKEIPEIALVLMDIKMPLLDGYAATRQILGFRPDLPIIALTAYAFPDDNEKAINSGCVDYLSKPLNRDMLFKVLARHLENGKKKY